MSNFLKPTKIVQTALGLLVREMTLPALVWKNPIGSFAGSYNDTVSIRLPAFVEATSRTLRAGTARSQSSLFERKVDLTLDTDIYLDVPITDELLTLDISDFGAQVLNPMVAGLARKYETLLAATMTNATYENEITYDLSSGDPYSDIAVAGRAYLNNANVPYDGRVIVVGAQIEAEFLNSDKFIKATDSGSDQTLREAIIGRVAGMPVISCPALEVDEAFVMHQTAFVLSTAAPLVPAGAPFGASSSYGGMALRLVRVFDADAIEDRIILDAWTGSDAVTDWGHYTADPDANGKFVPGDNPDIPNITTDGWNADTNKLVRAVKVTTTA